MKAALAIVCLLSYPLVAQVTDGGTSKPEAKLPLTLPGYVDCTNRDPTQPTPIYQTLCAKFPVGNLECGQRVAVSERHGTWLKIGLPDGSARYALSSEISKSDSKFATFDDNSGIADLGPVSCTDPNKPFLSAPVLTFDPEPEYSDLARKKKISSSVYLSLTVGKDGVVHEIKIEKKLGYGLDEEALKAVRRWKFKPAMKDGQPVEARLTVSVSFRLH